jgi:hypothetical protein
LSSGTFFLIVKFNDFGRKILTAIRIDTKKVLHACHNHVSVLYTLGKHMFLFHPTYKSREFSHDCRVVWIGCNVCFRMSTIIHRVPKYGAHLVSLATFLINVYWNIFSVLQRYGEEEWRNLPVLLQSCACFSMKVKSLMLFVLQQTVLTNFTNKILNLY